MLKNIGLLLAIMFVLLGLQVVDVLAYDFVSDSGIGETGVEAGYHDANLTEDSLAQTIGKIIRAVIAFVGVFFLLLTIYGGLIWMFSRGNEQEVEKAKKILQNAIIGLIVVLLAYGITYFLTNILASVQVAE